MSLQLFSQLLAALKPGAKLLLLGDENQLASVDAGNVLAELCHSGLLASCTSPKVVNRLTVNYRSKDNKALCDYTDALVADDGKPDVDGLFNGGQGEKHGLFHAIEIIDNKSEREKQLKEVVASTLDGLKIKFGEDAQERRLVDCWKAPRSLEEAFAIIDSFKILSPVREGLYGIVSLNHIMRKYLDMKGEYDNGVPVLITENDSVTGLQNGDVGVCYKGQVWFKQSVGDDGKEKTQAYNPVQLPPHECAFAMTMHKSQGSDSKNVLMVLPDKDSALLTRELVYTGITRTKTNFMLLAKRAILEKAQSRKTVRWSGLGKRLGL